MKFPDVKSSSSLVTALLFFVPCNIVVSAQTDELVKHDPPCKTIEEIVCGTNSFSTFCNALDKTGLDGRLDSHDSDFTVFVPINSAFDYFLEELDFGDIYDCPETTLEHLLRTHIVEDHVILKEDLKDRCGDVLEMDSGEKTRTVCQNSAQKIFQKGSGNSEDNFPRIISFDIDACNGVIHVMYRVILPSGLGLPTRKPTSHPAPMPTRHPTKKPTWKPYFKPTRYPTKKPTRKPTRRPVHPTRKPSSKPTIDVDSASCSAHPKCAAAGLTGDCCPTKDGKRLDCCSNFKPTHKPTPKPTFKEPTSKPTHRDGSCAAYPRCIALNLEGECCPTEDGEKLSCCFDDEEPKGSCSAYPKCIELGLRGDCCPTDDGMKLDCCFDKVPGTCSSYPGCAKQGLLGDCCPAANGKNLDCCGNDDHGFPIVDQEYCRYPPDFSCYKFGRPECCLKSSLVCPKEEPQCEVGFPIIGDSYCTFAPNYGCYKNGWPQCCSDDPRGCPEQRPDCEIGNPVTNYSYCRKPPKYKCYELGYPSCCLSKDSNDCPYEAPSCNVGKRGCDLNDSLPSIYDFVCTQSNFNILCHLIKKAGIDELLDDTGTYTMFAPSNDAFEKLGDEVVMDLLDHPTSALKNILKYHISDKIYFEQDLYCEKKIDTLLGDSSDDFTITKCNSQGRYQKGNGNENGNIPFILATDIVTCNGVIHVISKVILPKN